MATKTWQNGGVDNNWSTVGNWVEGSKPAAGDDVIIAANYNCVVNEATAALKSFDMTGYAAVLSGTFSITVTVSSGTVVCKFANGVSGTWSGSLLLNPAAGTTINLTCGGWTTWNAITIAGSGSGMVNVLDAISLAATKLMTLTSGIVHMDGATDNAGLSHSVGIFSSSNSNSRSIILGTCIITCTGSSTTVWNTATISNLTLNAGTSTIICNGSAVTFNCGGKTFYSLQLTGSATATVTGANQFTNLIRIGTASSYCAFSIGSNTGVTGSFVLTGNSGLYRLFVYGPSAGITITNIGATMSWSYVSLQDIGLSDAYDASAITGGCGFTGGLTNITCTPARTLYWHVGSGSFSTASKWYDASNGGGTQQTIAPLLQDTCIFDASSFDSSGSITMDYYRYPTLDFSGINDAAGLYFNYTSKNYYGSLTFSSNVTFNQQGGWGFYSRNNCSLNCAGKTLYLVTISLKSTAILQLTGNFASSSDTTFIHSSGIFDANDYNVSCRVFRMGGTNTRSVLMGSGTWTVYNTQDTVWECSSTSGLTFDAEGSTIAITNTGSSSKTFQGAGLAFNNLTITGGGTGAIIVTGSNSFNILTIGAPKTVTFPNSTTTVASLVAAGDDSNQIIFQRTGASGSWTLSCAVGTINASYCTISNSIATGGAIFNALTGCVNGGGNSGWNFTSSGTTDLVGQVSIFRRLFTSLQGRMTTRRYGYKNL